MVERNLRPADLVRAAPGHVTFKMVSRACRGRRLTAHSQRLIAAAFNQAAQTQLTPADLFTYSA